MNLIEVTIHPQGWIFLAVVILIIFLWGYAEGWTARRKIADRDQQTFDFEKENKST